MIKKINLFQTIIKEKKKKKPSFSPLIQLSEMFDVEEWEEAEEPDEKMKKGDEEERKWEVEERTEEREPELAWKIGDMKSKLEKGSFKLVSKSFAWPNNFQTRSQLHLQMTEEGDGLYAWLSMEYGPLCGKSKRIVVFPNVLILFKYQSHCGFKQHVITSLNCPFNTHVAAFLHRKRRIALKSFLTNPYYNNGDSILVEVRVEPRAIARKVFAWNGSFSWAVDNYRRRKELEQKGYVECQEGLYFYTGIGGYRVRLKIFLDGFGAHRGKGLTIGVIFLTGKYDKFLLGEFPHKTEVIILDRKQFLRSIYMTVEHNVEEGKALQPEYYIDVCGEEEMERLVHDDILYCDVDITPTKAKKTNLYPKIRSLD